MKNNKPIIYLGRKSEFLKAVPTKEPIVIFLSGKKLFSYIAIDEPSKAPQVLNQTGKSC